MVWNLLCKLGQNGTLESEHMAGSDAAYYIKLHTDGYREDGDSLYLIGRLGERRLLDCVFERYLIV